MSKRCPYCREYIQDEALKCRYCGEFLGSSADFKPAPPLENHNSWQRQYEERKTDPGVHPVTGEIMRPRPKSNLVWGILTTILCCMPFGVVSIVYAAKVDEAYNSGFIEEAYRSSKKAETWAIVSLVVQIVGIIAYVAILAAGALFS